MSERNQAQQNPSLRRVLRTGLESQTDPLDKIWYAVNFSAYNALHEDVDLAVNSSSQLEGDYANEQERAQALEAYRRAHPETYFTPSELQDLHVPTSRQYFDEVTEAGRLLNNTLNRDEGRFTTPEQDNEHFYNLGIVGTKVCHELGKEYRAWQDKLREKDPNDPLINEKAAYLMYYDQHSKTALLNRGYKNYQQRQSINLEGSQEETKRLNSIFKDTNALKQMTMGEFCSKAMMSREQQEQFLADNQLQGMRVTEQTNAYDYFRMSQQEYDVKQGNAPETDPQKLDQKLARNAFKLHRKGMRNYQTALGRDFAKSNLSREDQKLVEEGSAFFEMLNYKAPRSIREWAEKEGKQMTRENRIQKVNDAYRDYSKVIRTKEPLEIQKDQVLAPSFEKNPSKDRYEQYLMKHTGESTRALSPEQKRTCLANAMACAALKGSGKSFDTSTIHAWGKQIMKKDAFRELKDVEVSRYLFNKKTVDDGRYDLVNKLYAVPKANRQAYLNQMKSLSKDMYSASGDSKEYKAMAECVKKIGDMDPADPNLEGKLLIANENLRGAIKIYTKGKKSVRTFQDGRDKFDNALDALSVMKKHVPGMKQEADELVARTNTVRKVKEGDPYYVDLDQFGVSRAKEANLERRLENMKEGSPDPHLNNNQDQMLEL